jgi:hypothetical protein
VLEDDDDDKRPGAGLSLQTIEAMDQILKVAGCRGERRRRHTGRFAKKLRTTTAHVASPKTDTGELLSSPEDAQLSAELLPELRLSMNYECRGLGPTGNTLIDCETRALSASRRRDSTALLQTEILRLETMTCMIRDAEDGEDDEIGGCAEDDPLSLEDVLVTLRGAALHARPTQDAGTEELGLRMGGIRSLALLRALTVCARRLRVSEELARGARATHRLEIARAEVAAETRGRREAEAALRLQCLESDRLLDELRYFRTAVHRVR